jgi:hypothetical protein
MSGVRWTAITVAAMFGVGFVGAAHAQVRCNNANSVGCDWEKAQRLEEANRAESQAAASRSDAAYQAMTDALNQPSRASQSNLRAPGTCDLSMYESPTALPVESQRGLLEDSTERCLTDHDSQNCLYVAIDHAGLAIPEAHPDQAYHFMQLACQYGDTGVCQQMKTHCSPK